MIISAIDNANKFVLRWRDENNKRLESEVSYADFNPYFYILANETERSGVNITEYVNGRKDSFRINIDYTVDGSVSLDGKALKKVTWSPPKPGYTRELRKQWSQTFEADVPFHYRYAIDCLTVLPEYKLRKFYWDLEWQQRGSHDGAITCISYYDNYTKESNVYWWQPDSIDRKVSGHSKPFETERMMLSAFVDDIIDKVESDMIPMIQDTAQKAQRYIPGR